MAASILVTSALEGEGKSTVAANVAAALARAADRTCCSFNWANDEGVAGATRRKSASSMIAAERILSLDKAVLWYGEGRP